MEGLLCSKSHFAKEFSMSSLRQRMTEDMQVRNLALNTQASYLQQVSLFARHFEKSPEQLGPEQIRDYQVYLTNEKKLAPGSVLIAVAALRFLYKVSLRRNWIFGNVIPAPKKPQTLPVILSPEEVLQFLGCVRDRKHHAILTTCYAAGLRISEAVHLTVPDIDSARMVIRVDQGKGQKDRYVMLSQKLRDILRDWWRVEKPRHWLFPGVIEGRHTTRDAVELACQKARLRFPVRKPVTPHSLRNASAYYTTFQSVFILKIIGARQAQLAAGTDSLNLDLHLRETEILLIDNPGCTVNDLRRWQNPLADESFHNGIAHLEFTRRLLLSYPAILSQEWLDFVIPAQSGDARSIPGLLLAGLIAQAIQNGGDDLIRTDLCEFTY
jgi:integrase/recombinase XerD